MKQQLVFGVIGLGVVLLVLSGLWTTIFPPTSNWSSEKELRWREVKQRIHNLSFTVNNSQSPTMHGGPDPGQAKQEYDELQKENAQLTAEFQTAAYRPNTVSKFLKWTGISLAIVGIIGWFAVKE